VRSITSGFKESGKSAICVTTGATYLLSRDSTSGAFVLFVHELSVKIKSINVKY
jgi:hypothetical protein